MERKKEAMFSRRELIRIVIPIALQGLLSVAIGMADSMMVSNKGEDAFAGVSLISALDTVLITLFNAVTAGGSVVLSQAIGRGDRDSAINSAKQLLYATFAVATAISAVVLIFRVPLLNVLYGDVEASVMRSALTYFTIVAFSFPLLAVENAVSAVFRVQGDSVTTLKISIFMNTLNIVGNAVLIYGVNLGVAGAALATLISRLVGASVLLWKIHNRNLLVYIEKLFHYRPDFSVIKEILRIGIPNGIENSMFQFGRLMTTSLVSSLGTVAIAANSATLQLANFQYTVGGSIQTAMVTVVGRCVGAGEKEQAMGYAKRLIKWAYIMIFITNIILCVFSVPLLKLFGLTPESTSLSIFLIIYHSIMTCIAWPLSFCIPPAFRAAGDVSYSMVVSIFSMWVFRVFVAHVLALESVSLFGVINLPGFGIGIMGVWYGMAVDFGFRTILFTARFKSGRWLKRVKE